MMRESGRGSSGTLLPSMLMLEQDRVRLYVCARLRWRQERIGMGERVVKSPPACREQLSAAGGKDALGTDDAALHETCPAL